MGQIEVYKWLEKKRNDEEDKFFDTKDIQDGLNKEGIKSTLHRGIRFTSCFDATDGLLG